MCISINAAVLYWLFKFALANFQHYLDGKFFLPELTTIKCIIQLLITTHPKSRYKKNSMYAGHLQEFERWLPIQRSKFSNPSCNHLYYAA